MALFYVFAGHASQLVLAATTVLLYVRLRSRATACLALGQTALFVICILGNLFSAVPDELTGSCAECGRIWLSSPPIWRYLTPAFYVAGTLHIVGFVWFAADILRKRGPHNPRIEPDAAGDSEGREE